MRYFYEPKSDSLYLTIAEERKYGESVEVVPGVVLDFDTSGRVIGLDLEHASKSVDIADLTLEAEPTMAEVARARLDGKQLKQERELLDLSQAALGQALGVSPNTVARWERGELRIEHPNMLRLALSALRVRSTQQGTVQRSSKTARVSRARRLTKRPSAHRVALPSARGSRKEKPKEK